MNKTVRTILIVLFVGLFLYFGGHIVSVKLRYRESRLLYEGAANTYTAEAHSKPDENGGASTLELVAPITVDFDKLCEINDDVFAWISRGLTRLTMTMLPSGMAGAMLPLTTW